MKIYLRKRQVADRYQTTPRNVDRMVVDRRIPAPDFYNGRSPLWDAAKLDANDRAAAARSHKLGDRCGGPKVKEAAATDSTEAA